MFDAERAYWGDPMSEWFPLLGDVPDAYWQGYGSNLSSTGDPILTALYKGMYFILNILETTRLGNSLELSKHHLATINRQLEDFEV